MTKYLKTVYPNNSKAAHGVLEAAKALDAGASALILRPFNRFELAYTEWWMIPSSDWPAFHHGKLTFWRFPAEPESPMYVGYCVEKGFGPEADSMPDVRSSHIMRPHWYWHKFIQDAPGKEFRTAVQSIQSAVRFPLRLLALAYEFNRVPNPDEERVMPDDYLEIEFDSDGEGTKTLKSAANSLRPLDEADKFSRLLAILRTLDLRFHWIDLIVGIPFAYTESDKSAWGPSQLWRNTLAPWLPWVR